MGDSIIIRYYADARDVQRHGQILDLLDSISLDTEVVRIDIQHGQIRREHETQDAQDAYRRLLIASGIERSMGVSPDDVVPVAPALAGRVGVSLRQSETIDYITPAPHRRADSVDSENWCLPVTPVGLLMALRDDADAVISNLQHRIKVSGTETEILENWLQDPSTPISEAKQEVKLGPDATMPEGVGEGTRTMRADALSVTGDGSAELLEVKQQWNGAALQKAFGQLCFGREMVEQFQPDVNVCGSILILGESEWSPSWGFPGSTKPKIEALNEAGIRVWLDDRIHGWTRLNNYL